MIFLKVSSSNLFLFCYICLQSVSLQADYTVCIVTRRYSPLCGLTSSSCGGLRPTAETFLALWGKKEVFMPLGQKKRVCYALGAKKKLVMLFLLIFGVQ